MSPNAQYLCSCVVSQLTECGGLVCQISPLSDDDHEMSPMNFKINFFQKKCESGSFSAFYFISLKRKCMCVGGGATKHAL